MHGMPVRGYPALLRLVASGAVDPARLIGRRIALESAGAALAAMDRPAEGITVISPEPRQSGARSAGAPRSPGPRRCRHDRVDDQPGDEGGEQDAPDQDVDDRRARSAMSAKVSMAETIVTSAALEHHDRDLAVGALLVGVVVRATRPTIFSHSSRLLLGASPCGRAR